MFSFDLKRATIYQAVKWSKFFRLAKLFKSLFLVIFVLLFLVFLYGFIGEAFSIETQRLLLGGALVMFVFTIGTSLKILFFESKLKNPKLKHSIKESLSNPEKFNLAELLSFEVAKSVSKSIKLANSKKIVEVNSSILAFYILNDNPDLKFIFFRFLLDLKEVSQIFKAHLNILKKGNVSEEIYSDDFKQTILKSLEIADKKGHERIEIGDTITALAEYDSIFKKILVDLKLTVDDVENLTWWLESLKEKAERKKRFWEWENLIRKGSIAKEWASGYSVALDKFSTDLSQKVRLRGFPEIISHGQEIKQTERVLARREINNVLLIGEPGVGMQDIVLGIAQRSVLGQSLPEVNHKRVIQLDLSSILAQTESNEEVENVLDRIFQEVISAGNIILAIDDFHNYVGGQLQPGMIDISGIISKYLHLSQFQIMAITNFTGLHVSIEQNPSILSLFEKVEVPQVSKRETLMILERLTLFLEQRHDKFISYPALRDIIKYCDKYLQSIPFPKKAVDLLDEVMVQVSIVKEKVVKPEHVAKVFSEKTQIPVGDIEKKEKDTLLNLENLIHQRIINQEEAVKEVSGALRRARSEISVRKGSMGTFLFLGPTGVGKTETAKALSEIYFGSEDKMIRLDMSEFQAIEDIPRLIGESGKEGLLTTRVREDPFSLILLDEFEKAHPNILNLFLQVFDEGHITDGLGRKVSFQNNIIIATSNAGYSVILEALKENLPMLEIKNKLLDYIFKNRIFRPELVNRFDAAIIFKSLNKEHLLKISKLLLLKSKKNLKKKSIEFEITPGLLEKIVELGYDPTFGARAMKRVIQNKVENVLAEGILREEIKRGDRVAIDPEGFKLIINPK